MYGWVRWIRRIGWMGVLGGWVVCGGEHARADSPEEPDTSSSWVLIPFPIYSPETEWAGTLAALWLHRASAEAQPSSFLMSTAYSQRRQFFLFLTPEAGFREGRLRADAQAGFRDWPDRFYGIGHDTPEHHEETYTNRSVFLGFSLRQRLASGWAVGGRGEWADSRIQDTLPGGLFEQGGIFGSPASTYAGAGLLVTWDSRDDRFAPRSGAWIDLSAMAYRETRASENFQQLRLDARRFWVLRSYGVLAMQGYMSFSFGEVPFQQLSRIGDMRGTSLMRGIYSGRYRDRNVAVAQAEWRFPIRGPLSGVVFSGSGVIGDTLWDARKSSVYVSGGGGIRYRISPSERVNLRLDVAAASGSTGVYFSFLEAF